MDCCKIPEHVLEKVEGVRKEMRVQKLNRVMRVAGELSWNGWERNAVVNRLYPEYDRVAKQGASTKRRLNKIAKSLTRQLKGLNYTFPPREKFCSLHMWFGEEVSRTHEQPSTLATKKQSEIATRTPPPLSRITRSQTREKINLRAQGIARREVFMQTENSRQDLLLIIRRVIEELSDEDAPDDVVVSRVEKRLLAESSSDELTHSHSSSSADSDAIAEGIELHNSTASSSFSESMGSIEGKLSEESCDQMVENPVPKVTTIVPSNLTKCGPSNEVHLVEAPSIVSWRAKLGNPVVPYDSHDAQVTANLLALLSNAEIDWTVKSRTFSGLVLHALQLRTSRLNTYYYEKCAQKGRVKENMRPMSQSRDLSLQEDRATLSDVLATFKPCHQSVFDLYLELRKLIGKRPVLQHPVPSMTCPPIIARWDLPSSLSVLEKMNRKADWRSFQLCIEDCIAQIRQDPDSRETLEMLEGMPKLIETRSPAIAKHPQVQEWVDRIRKLADAIRSKEASKVEFEVTMQQFREYERRSMKALGEIESKLNELWRCDHQLGLLRARSESRINAMRARNQHLIEQRENLLNELQRLDVRIAQGERDMAQEYAFGVDECVVPWSLAEVMRLLEPMVIKLTEFLRQLHGYENLGDMLKERVDGKIRLLAGMVCNFQAIEASTTVVEEREGYLVSSLSSNSRSRENCDTGGARGSKKQRLD